MHRVDVRVVRLGNFLHKNRRNKRLCTRCFVIDRPSASLLKLIIVYFVDKKLVVRANCGDSVLDNSTFRDDPSAPTYGVNRPKVGLLYVAKLSIAIIVHMPNNPGLVFTATSHENTRRVQVEGPDRRGVPSYSVPANPIV